MESVDQTSLEFLYPLPSYLVVDLPITNTLDIKNHTLEVDSYSGHINDISVYRESSQNFKYDSNLLNDEEPNKHQSENNIGCENSCASICIQCDTAFNVSKIEEVINSTENGLTSAKFYI